MPYFLGSTSLGALEFVKLQLVIMSFPWGYLPQSTRNAYDRYLNRRGGYYNQGTWATGRASTRRRYGNYVTATATTRRRYGRLGARPYGRLPSGNRPIRRAYGYGKTKGRYIRNRKRTTRLVKRRGRYMKGRYTRRRKYGVRNKWGGNFHSYLNRKYRGKWYHEKSAGRHGHLVNTGGKFEFMNRKR